MEINHYYDKYHLNEIEGHADARHHLNIQAYWKLGHWDFSIEDIEYEVVLEASATLIDNHGFRYKGEEGE